MADWIKDPQTQHGLSYREHDTVTLGTGRSKRALRYYRAVYRWQGKLVTDIYGWENEYHGGHHTIEALALQYKVNRKTGVAPFTHKGVLGRGAAKWIQENQETPA